MSQDYRVVLEQMVEGGKNLEFKITADDVDLRVEDDNNAETAWFNFTRSDVTVAAVPLSRVLFITS
jgi:hypothetical protein